MKRNSSDKHGVSGRNSMKALVLTLGVVLLLYAAVGGSLAYLVMETASIDNQFREAYVDCTVNSEDFSITNDGNVDAYIRAAVVVNWASDTGDDVYGIPPKYSISISASSDWDDANPWYLDPSTGFYYCKSAIAAGGKTSPLVTGFSAGEPAPEGYSLRVEVVAEAIQAEGYGSNGKLAAENAWGITLYGKD